jgi:hypothetical protein
MGERARSRLCLGETAMAMVRSVGTRIPVVLKSDERAGR